MKTLCLRAVSKNIELVVTTAEGLDGSVEEDKYSPLIRFADGTVFTGSSKDIISSPSSLSSIPAFTCKDLLLAFQYGSLVLIVWLRNLDGCSYYYC